MKYIQVLLVIALILISLASSSKVERRRRRGEVLRGLASFAFGCLSGLTEGASSEVLKECIPAAWLAKVGNGLDNGEPATQFGAGNTGPLNMILSILGSGISLACKAKAKIISWLQGKVKRRLRWYRYFAESERRMTRKMSRGFRDKLKSVANKAVSGVKNAATTVKNVAVDAMDAIVGDFKKVVDAIKGVVHQILNFFQSPLFKELVKMFTCIINNRGKILAAAKKVIEVVKGFMANVTKLTSGPPGIVEVLVNCICNYSKFKTAVQHLIDFIKASGQNKWSPLGKFLGWFVNAVGTAK
jgi:hypothetical protein